jgi:hypothetical protein
MQQEPREINQQYSFRANGSFTAYGAGIRKQVFELVVQQALNGASWRDVCATHMKLNLISPQEVEQEVQRRTMERQPQSLQHAWLDHKARLNSMKHSEQSPCPCNSCMAEVLKMREFKFAPSPRV